jgi:antitoxin MazE
LLCIYKTQFMKIPIIAMGHSKGILLTESILKKFGITDVVELVLELDGIKIRPSISPRLGWANAFQKMHDAGDDELLINDSMSDWIDAE